MTKKPNKPIFIPSYSSVPSVAKNMILQNKPNLRSSIANQEFRNEPNPVPHVTHLPLQKS